ncbi:MAG: flgE [Herminiimonas sp.]|nr:flgE [Herminiimonas sp.]
MSFQQGLSGLNAASKQLESIGNNVANANTVGFKQSQVSFADVYANSLTVVVGTQIGTGTKLNHVTQQFSQGNVTASNNPLDLAINGGGFFRMSNNGAITYGRNGQFQLDKSGYIVNPNGARLTGYAADTRGVLQTGSPKDILISNADLPPSATKDIKAVLNLDSRNAVPATTPFSMDDPTSFNSATSGTVYDSLGNSHVLQTYYVKSGVNTWNIYGAVDEVPLNFTPASAGPPAVPASQTPIGSLGFGPDGGLDAATQASMPFSTTIPLATGASTPLVIAMDYSSTTQFGALFNVNTLRPDGNTSGSLSGFSVGADGTITGRYTNGKSNTLGQVVLANFTNPNGLQPLGDNVWSESTASGGALIGTPSSGTLGALQSSAVEDSNVDLTAELVNMITAQRFYQANAQTIKTQDQAMQTLMNLR